MLPIEVVHSVLQSHGNRFSSPTHPSEGGEAAGRKRERPSEDFEETEPAEGSLEKFDGLKRAVVEMDRLLQRPRKGLCNFYSSGLCGQRLLSA